MYLNLMRYKLVSIYDNMNLYRDPLEEKPIETNYQRFYSVTCLCNIYVEK